MTTNSNSHLQERRLFTPTPHHTFLHDPSPSGRELPCWYDMGRSFRVGVVICPAWGELQGERMRFNVKNGIGLNGAPTPCLYFIRRRRFEEVILEAVTLLSASRGRRFLGGRSWDQGQIRGRARGGVIWGWGVFLGSPHFLECDPLSSLRPAVSQVDDIATAVVAVPSLTYTALPIEVGRGFSSTHPLLSRVPALDPSRIRVTGAFHDLCLPRT